ncbi:hypothetical protein GCM10022631_12080 [Deinococcus rubellus]|uniref:Uncharacterized protein n=1 Tax=Deinococcus rubellus TaxID=1889240 RepID=A0ABY5YDF1_9DEIO|nr:hypothetical protein [Deinococcus rubellus]UWX62746.1 hypothetical protein N0D28_08165 [Deinococcus rubellus]
MTSRLAFNLGAALIFAGIALLLTLDAFTGLSLAAVGLIGLALVLAGVVLTQRAEVPALEATK